MTIRKTEEKIDAAALRRWIDADIDHRGKVDPEFFCDNDGGVESMAFTDEDGTVFYVRISKVLRVDIQFAPAAEVGQQRVTNKLKEGFGWLLASARRCGYRQVIFQSKVEPLIRFCKKRFGFEESPGELVCNVAPASGESK